MSGASDNYVVISLNLSSTGSDVVTLKFNGNPNQQIEYGADTEYKRYGIGVLDNEGETPWAKNMRALLRYNGGTLEYEGVKYNIQVESVEEGSVSTTDNDEHNNLPQVLLSRTPSSNTSSDTFYWHQDRS